jgi:hypothetical protein
VGFPTASASPMPPISATAVDGKTPIATWWCRTWPVLAGAWTRLVGDPCAGAPGTRCANSKLPDWIRATEEAVHGPAQLGRVTR